MDFEWDDDKEAINIRKHGYDFNTAARVFFDPHRVELDDVKTRSEWRGKAIGMTNGRMVAVIYTARGNMIRIISARKATPYEKRQYHES